MDASAQFKKSITANQSIMQSIRTAGFRNVTRAECISAIKGEWRVYTTDAPRRVTTTSAKNVMQAKLADVGLMFRGYGEDGQGKYIVIETGVIDLKEKAR